MVWNPVPTSRLMILKMDRSWNHLYFSPQNPSGDGETSYKFVQVTTTQENTNSNEYKSTK